MMGCLPSTRRGKIPLRQGTFKGKNSIYTLVKDLAVKLGNDHTFDANVHSSYDDINIPARFGSMLCIRIQKRGNRDVK